MAFAKVGNGPRNFFAKPRSRSKTKRWQPSSGRTYIVPTAFGLIFGTLIFALFLAGLMSANNLLYMIVFTIVSMLLTSMVMTNNQINRIQILALQPQEGFADEGLRTQVALKNLAVKSDALDLEILQGKTTTSLARLPAGSEQTIELQGPSLPRGWQRPQRISLRSTYPFGLNRAWKTRDFDKEVLVYPAREGTKTFPQGQGPEGRLGSQGLFRDHRLFQSGDSFHRVDWRASARRQELLVKNFESENQQALDFSWEQTSHLPGFEKRLSQLTLWIDEADKRQLTYSLSIGSFQVQPDRGPEHRKTCLRYLAEMQNDPRFP